MKNQASNIAAKATIERLLGLTEESHNIYIYDIGIDWLNHKQKLVPHQRQIWERSKVFWQWWIMQWNIRCTQILETMGYSIHERIQITEDQKRALLECYYSKHYEVFGRYPNQALRRQIREEMKEHDIEVPIIRILIKSHL